jgi:hypothetical protein
MASSKQFMSLENSNFHYHSVYVRKFRLHNHSVQQSKASGTISHLPIPFLSTFPSVRCLTQAGRRLLIHTQFAEKISGLYVSAFRRTACLWRKLISSQRIITQRPDLCVNGHLKMPKAKCSDSSSFIGFLQEFDEKYFSTEGKILLCKVCEISVTAAKCFCVRRHCETAKHQKNLHLQSMKQCR